MSNVNNEGPNRDKTKQPKAEPRPQTKDQFGNKKQFNRDNQKEGRDSDR